MYILWTKLKMLQPTLRLMSREYINMDLQIDNARSDLQKVQNLLAADRMNPTLLLNEKKATAQLLLLGSQEEKILQQRSKVTWLKLGDENNSYFHASVRDKQASVGINQLINEHGQVLKTQEELEGEILNFYQQLVGTAAHVRTGLGLEALRNGKQLSSRTGGCLLL